MYGTDHQIQSKEKSNEKGNGGKKNERNIRLKSVCDGDVGDVAFTNPCYLVDDNLTSERVKFNIIRRG